jgi:predicted enzyme related to lactoylglutathione lyase
MPGTPIVHIEFKSADFVRTSAFYAKLFDWKVEPNASNMYLKADSMGGPSGGWVRADLVQSPGPIAYLVVDDLAAKLDEVEGAGGRVLVRSMPFAGGGEVGLFADPDGNVLGLWKRKDGAGAGAGGGAAASAAKVTAQPAAAKAVKAAKPAAAKPAAKPKKK